MEKHKLLQFHFDRAMQHLNIIIGMFAKDEPFEHYTAFHDLADHHRDYLDYLEKESPISNKIKPWSDRPLYELDKELKAQAEKECT